MKKSSKKRLKDFQDGKLCYKIIGTRFTLYVLCRNINNYILNYEDEVKVWCSNNGFIFPWNKYVKTY